MDRLFQVACIASTSLPQRCIYRAMHQDYSEGYVSLEEVEPLESEAGEICVKRLLAGGRGHYGPLEHPQITFNAGYFPHSVVQQARTHRVGVSFDVQSMRYTGNRICRAAREELPIEDVFYVRPVGEYKDRHGKHYTYSELHRWHDLCDCLSAAVRYKERILAGFSEEHARGLLPFDYRQHFVVSFTLRALLHFLDLRFKRDAQLEIYQLCELLWPHVEEWVPQIASWYQDTRLHKAKLAP